MTDARGQLSPLTRVDLQAYMERHDINARLIDDIGDTPTVLAAAAALGVEADQILKTLLFLVEQTNAAGRPVQPLVVISNGESRVDKRPLADHFGVGKKRVRLAPADVVLELLGYPAGGVPPVGHRNQFPVILDSAVVAIAAGGDRLFAGGGDDRTMMELTLGELQRVMQPLVLAVSQG